MENNNIEIRNLYINKIKKKFNNLIHCIKLLNNLNNVINNQKGGSKSSNTDESIKNAINANQTALKFNAGILASRNVEPILTTQINIKYSEAEALQLRINRLTQLNNKLKTQIEDNSYNNKLQINEYINKIKDNESIIEKLQNDITELYKTISVKDEYLNETETMINDLKMDLEISNKTHEDYKALMDLEVEKLEKALEETRNLITIPDNCTIVQFNLSIDNLIYYFSINTHNIAINNIYKSLSNINKEKLDFIVNKIKETNDKLFLTNEDTINTVIENLKTHKITQEDINTHSELTNNKITVDKCFNTTDVNVINIIKTMISENNEKHKTFMQQYTQISDLIATNLKFITLAPSAIESYFETEGLQFQDFGDTGINKYFNFEESDFK